MKYSKVKVLFVDQQRNTVELEMDSGLYRLLGIKKENIKQHSKRVELNQTITEFLNNKDEK